MSYMYEFSLYLQKYYTCVSICTLLFVGNKEYLSKKDIRCRLRDNFKTKTRNDVLFTVPIYKTITILNTGYIKCI